jgi:hypothetical protein
LSWRVLPAHHEEAWQASGDHSHSPQIGPNRLPPVKHKEAYNESVFHKSEADAIRRTGYRLRKQAAQLGFQVIPGENG